MCIAHFVQGEEKNSGLILLNIGGKEFMTKVWLEKSLDISFLVNSSENISKIGHLSRFPASRLGRISAAQTIAEVIRDNLKPLIMDDSEYCGW